MKIKILFAIVPTMFLMALFASCEDNKKEYLSEFNTIFYFLKSGVQPLTMYKTGEPVTVSAVINKAGSDLSTRSSVKVERLNESWLSGYNEENNTSYKLLPAGCYKIPESITFEFSGSKDTYKTLDITFDADAIYDLDDQEGYVLPLKLISPDSVNVMKNIVFYSPIVKIPTVAFGQTGYMRNDFTDGGSEEMNFSLPLVLSIPNKWNFTCKVEVDKTLLDKYNLENNLNYRLLPEGSYTMSGNGTVSYTESDKTKKLEIRVNNKQLTYGNYVLPLRLTDCSKDGFDIDKANDVCLYGVSYIPDASKLQPIALTANMLSTNAQEPNEGPIANLLDGNIETFFHSLWSNTISGAHYIQVKLNQEYSAFSFSFTTRHNNYTVNPASVLLYVSQDGTTFVKVGEITENLPAGVAMTYNSALYVAPPFKYFRFVVPKNKSNGVYFALSKFSMKGL